MKKFKAVLMGICLLAMVGTQPAFAANQEFNFDFDSLYQKASSDPATKSDSEQNWYISFEHYNKYGQRNTMSSSNIFGCRIHSDYDNSTPDRYHTFSNYVNNYRMPYQRYVASGTDMYLRGQKDDDSKSGAELLISGLFCP